VFSPKQTTVNRELEEGNLKLTKIIIVFFLFTALTFSSVQPALCWSNGGYSDNPAQPKYGTHDWIAQHALDWLPTEQKKYITDNLAAYLYGTELPDNSQAVDGIGDTGKHHIYFTADGSMQDDAAARRASDEYQKALNYLKNKDYTNAAKTAGIMTHYIADVAVFGHMMGSKTHWGTEVHHSDYESYVDDRTGAYDSNFNSYLHFDGVLTTTSAYNVAKNIAYDTTFGGSGNLTCVWMDHNFNWNNPTFASRCGQSLNLAVNGVADILYTLYQAASSSSDPTSTSNQSTQNPTVPEFPTILILAVAMLAVMVTAIAYKKKQTSPF
jgi:hypothetical protein